MFGSYRAAVSCQPTPPTRSFQTAPEGAEGAEVMDSITSNVSDVIRLEAMQRALAILNSEPGCISYVRPEDLETAALFIPVISIIKPIAEDFHPSIPGIGILPKVPLQNAIREKSGTNIIRTDDGKRSEYVWTAHSYGERRMPDGSIETTDGVYEFDAEKRAELDFLKDAEKQQPKYTTKISKRKYVLELCKFGQSKAVTGAQWIVIKKLAKIAASFRTPEELMRGMKLIRYDRNINGIMQDPTMRGAIIEHALGATREVFGPEPAKQIPRTVDVESGEMVPAATVEPGQFPLDTFDDEPAKPAITEKTPLEKAREHLETYRDAVKASPKATALLNATLAKADATEQEISLLIDRFESYLQKAKEGAAS
jgi:hypothetical protein